MLLMPTVSTPNNHYDGLDLSFGGTGDDSWDYDELVDEVGLEVTEHAGDFIRQDLHLELRDLSPFLAEVMAFVHLLHCLLKL